MYRRIRVIISKASSKVYNDFFVDYSKDSSWPDTRRGYFDFWYPGSKPYFQIPASGRSLLQPRGFLSARLKAKIDLLVVNINNYF